jgi:hypothetical protein
MGEAIRPGDCVKLPDGRVARVREHTEDTYTVRVRRTTSKSHQFLDVPAADLEKADCPKGWMSPEGYQRYVKTTLAKQRERAAAKQ